MSHTEEMLECVEKRYGVVMTGFEDDDIQKLYIAKNYFVIELHTANGFYEFNLTELKEVVAKAEEVLYNRRYDQITEKLKSASPEVLESVEKLLEV
jgi:hypothetical protein